MLALPHPYVHKLAFVPTYSVITSAPLLAAATRSCFPRHWTRKRSVCHSSGTWVLREAFPWIGKASPETSATKYIMAGHVSRERICEEAATT
jgi:hypothetical protein